MDDDDDDGTAPRFEVWPAWGQEVVTSDPRDHAVHWAPTADEDAADGWVVVQGDAVHLAAEDAAFATATAALAYARRLATGHGGTVHPWGSFPAGDDEAAEAEAAEDEAGRACPECGLPLFRDEDGADTLWCGRCSLGWDPADLGRDEE